MRNAFFHRFVAKNASFRVFRVQNPTTSNKPNEHFLACRLLNLFQRKGKHSKGSAAEAATYPGSIENAPRPVRKKLEPRQVNPDFIASGAAYPVKVHLARGDVVEVHASSHFTIRELFEIIVCKLDMWQYDIWSLARVTTDATKQRAVLLETGGKYANQNIDWLDMSQTLEEAKITAGSALVLTIKYYKLYFRLEDPVATDLYYAQIRNEFLSGVHASGNSKTAVRLAALQLQAEQGDFSRGTSRKGAFTSSKISKLLPPAILARNSEDYLLQRIFFYHRRLAKTPKQEAQLAYIAESRNVSNWGATWFDCKLLADEKNLSRRLTLGVCEDGFVLPIRETAGEEEDENNKKRTMSRRKLLSAARTHSIMNVNAALDNAELGMLHQKSNDDQYEFFSYHATYIEETRNGLQLKKKGTSVSISLSKNQVDAVLSLSDTYMNLLTLSGWKELPLDELPPAADDCPDFKLFELPMDRSAARKELKRGKTMLELWKDNYLEIVAVAQRNPISRVMLQIEAKIDERVVLEEIDLMRASMQDADFKLIEESLAATYHVVQSSPDISFGADLVPRTLLLSYNELKNPDSLGETILALKLVTVSLRSNNLGPEWAAQFTKILPRCASLMDLDLSDNPLTSVGAIHVINGVLPLPSMRALNFANTGLMNVSAKWSTVTTSHGSKKPTMRGAETSGANVGAVIAFILVTCRKLERLDISDNVLTASGVEPIVDVLEKTDSLKHRLFELNFGNTHISGSIGNRLVRWLTKTFNDSGNHLTTLDLGSNEFDHETLALIADLFVPSATFRIRQANLSRLGFKWGPLNNLFSGLSSNSYVHHVNLSWNAITSKSAKELGHMVATTTVLQTLKLRGCSMERAALVALGEGMAKNTSITELDLADNNFEAHASAASWETALKRNKNLTQLNLACCNLDGDALENIASALKANTTLLFLHLDANYLGSRGVRKLGHGLKANATLKTLSMQDTDAKLKDMCAFLHEIASATNSGIQSIDLRHNPDLTHKSDDFDEFLKTTPNIAVRYSPNTKSN